MTEHSNRAIIVRVNEGRSSLVAGMPVTPNVHLLQPLGAGGMGAVWLANHTVLKRHVVVKFMLGGMEANAAARKRFTREAEAAAQVKSPHVVTMHDHGVTEDGVPFIVMEHLEGHDLGEELSQKGVLEPTHVIVVVQQVAKALTKVHAAGLLHRDIKPDNIFLCDGEDDTFVKLLDFGIAKSAELRGERDITLDGETKTGQVVGTPFYMSPEQVTAQKSIDARSDLWALGVVTFEALTGQRPFDGPSFGALAVKIATGSPTRPSSVNPSLPPSFDAWFAKACARDPADRFANAKLMAEALREAFNGVVSLPPSGVMSDSSGERKVPTPEPSGPTSLGNSKRPPTPTELASTVNQATPDPSLARSDAGSSRAVPSEPEAPKKNNSKMIGGIVALVAVAAGVVALGMGRGPAQTGTPATTSTVSSTTTANNAPPIASPATGTTVTSTPSTSPSTSTSTSASASAAPSASAHAPAKPIPVVLGKPTAPVKPTVSTKPEESAKPAPKPSTSGGDPLY